MCTGTVKPGTRIDTATVGRKAFKVMAVDAAGNRVAKTVHYRVRKQQKR